MSSTRYDDALRLELASPRRVGTARERVELGGGGAGCLVCIYVYMYICMYRSMKRRRERAWGIDHIAGFAGRFGVCLVVLLPDSHPPILIQKLLEGLQCRICIVLLYLYYGTIHRKYREGCREREECTADRARGISTFAHVKFSNGSNHLACVESPPLVGPQHSCAMDVPALLCLLFGFPSRCPFAPQPLFSYSAFTSSSELGFELAAPMCGHRTPDWGGTSNTKYKYSLHDVLYSPSSGESCRKSIYSSVGGVLLSVQLQVGVLGWPTYIFKISPSRYICSSRS